MKSNRNNLKQSSIIRFTMKCVWKAQNGDNLGESMSETHFANSLDEIEKKAQEYRKSMVAQTKIKGGVFEGWKVGEIITTIMW